MLVVTISRWPRRDVLDAESDGLVEAGDDGVGCEGELWCFVLVGESAGVGDG